MILVDTSIWIDHLRGGNLGLAGKLDAGQVLTHPLVIGELAMGDLRPREVVLRSLTQLPQAVMARDDEVLAYIDRLALHGKGIGYIDAHLLASTALTQDAELWTRDRRLAEIAVELGLAPTTPPTS